MNLNELLDGLQQSSAWYNDGWFSLVMFILGVIGMWKMFGEFGEKKWKSIIPIYNWYIFFRNIWSVGAFVVYIGANICISICTLIVELKNMCDGVIIVLGLVALVLFIARCIIWLRFVLKLNKAYEYSTFVGVLAIIAGIFIDSFVIVLYAFGKNRYNGSKSES